MQLAWIILTLREVWTFKTRETEKTKPEVERQQQQVTTQRSAIRKNMLHR